MAAMTKIASRRWWATFWVIVGALAGLVSAAAAVYSVFVPAQQYSVNDVVSDWDRIKNTLSEDVLDGFLGKHGAHPVYGILARERRFAIREGISDYWRLRGIPPPPTGFVPDGKEEQKSYRQHIADALKRHGK